MAFLAFEGMDGVGKTTLIQLFENILQKRKFPYISTREPGGTRLGEELRSLLLSSDSKEDRLTAKAELLLYQAARAQHVESKIQPALKKNNWVLCDRFTASSLAFQAGGGKINSKDVERLNKFATEGTEPDLWVLLDLSPDEAVKRIEKRLQKSNLDLKKDHFESQGKGFFKSVRDTYLKLAKKSPNKWMILDANEDPKRMIQQLEERLKKKGYL